MNNIIDRPVYINKLISFKDKDLIKVVTGIRRCGKSTLFDLYSDWLIQNGVNKNQIIRINFEDPAFDKYLEWETFYNYINSLISKEKKYYLFFDEIQNVNNFEKAIDGLYLNKKNDIYITGSNAYFLSGELATLLSGRYVQIKMQPLSFAEYVSTFGDKTDLIQKYVKYISTSSFPYVTKLNTLEEINSYLEGIYNTVLVKDIIARKNISDIALLNKIASFIFDSIGSPVSANNIANTLTSKGRKTSVHTVDNYLQAMINSFLCYKVERYDIKGKNLLVTQPKIYVQDIGLRNFLLGIKTHDRGHILENIVYLELLRRGGQVFVGKHNDMEIDFVTITNGIEKYYQVAYTAMDDSTLNRELKPLQMINNNYEKILLTMDYDIVPNHDGIKQINVLDWLLEE